MSSAGISKTMSKLKNRFKGKSRNQSRSEETTSSHGITTYTADDSDEDEKEVYDEVRGFTFVGTYIISHQRCSLIFVCLLLLFAASRVTSGRGGLVLWRH